LSVASSVADRHGFKRIDDIQAMRGKTSRDIIDALNVPLWRKSLDKIPLFPSVPDMLAALVQSGLTVAVVSSDSESNARRALGTAASLPGYFACGAALFGKARKFKQVMKAAGILATATLAIGDEVRDAAAAKAAGIDFAGVA